MANFTCCFVLLRNKKRNKVVAESATSPDFKNNLGKLKIRHEFSVKSFDNDGYRTVYATAPLPFGIRKDCLGVDATNDQKAVQDEAPEKAFGENATINREFSDVGQQDSVPNSGEKGFATGSEKTRYSKSNELNRCSEDTENGIELIQTGHLSDPGMDKPELWSSLELKRSCSNLETNKVLRKVRNRSIPASMASRPQNFMVPGTPESVVSHCSADRVMLKKHSSSQVLPSASRKLWWKLFLWSHKNLHKPWGSKPQQKNVNALDKQAGYTSNIAEPNRVSKFSKSQSAARTLNKDHENYEDDSKSWDDFHGGESSLRPQDQWIAFSTGSSSYARVDAWIRGLEHQPSPPSFRYDEGIVFPASPDIGISSKQSETALSKHHDFNLAEDIVYANCVIQSLCSSSTVAHISGIGLKVIPTMLCFHSLRSVNLSNNSIACITPGSLPKGLHTLNLSRNKIHVIDGLRELTRLRVLDLSYNRVTRIGQGLSNCTIIKELYLNGNKITEIDGLHRLLKLTVLDLSFNKIATTKAMGQLVANYNSLQALNLLGNPIQSNIGDDQLRKSVFSLLPKLIYLNKQQQKPKSARALTDNVEKAALQTSWSDRRKASKRGNSEGSGSRKHRGRSISTREKSRSRSKGLLDRVNTMHSALVSSSR